ncbi:MAG: hypothetical protein IPO08_20580 [Xanthomonadales bacterium]|nr:hypothetical protein [Xanthomonadales bacterium]
MTYYPPLWFEERLLECRRIAPVLDNVGALVWDCVVPAEWCPPGNKRDSLNWRDVHKMKENLRSVMTRQAQVSLRFNAHAHVGMRPVVTCYRYTPHRVDPRSNWDKFPVDLLTPYREVPIKGKRPRRSGLLGLIRDDSGDHIDLRAEWCKSKLGCVYVRVFSGAAS